MANANKARLVPTEGTPLPPQAGIASAILAPVPFDPSESPTGERPPPRKFFPKCRRGAKKIPP